MKKAPLIRGYIGLFLRADLFGEGRVLLRDGEWLELSLDIPMPRDIVWLRNLVDSLGSLLCYPTTPVVGDEPIDNLSFCGSIVLGGCF